MATNEGTSKRIKLLVIAIPILVILFVFLFVPTTSVIGFIQWTFLISFFLLILFTLGYLFYTMFLKPQKIDVSFVNRQKIVQSAKISNPPNIGSAYLTGDVGHSSVRLGKIIGWTQLQVYKPTEFDEMDTQKVVKEDIVAQDVFVIEKVGFPLNLFVDPIVLRVDPESHGSLVGDVYIKGFSLIKHSEYFYLNTDHLDVGKIDYNIWREGDRAVNKMMIADWKQTVDKAIGINPSHNLELERSKLMKVPQAPPQRPEV